MGSGSIDIYLDLVAETNVEAIGNVYLSEGSA